MDNLGTNTLSTLCSYLDLASIYAFLRSHRAIFRHWTDIPLWHTILYRDFPPILSYSADKRFSIDFLDRFHSYLWTKEWTDCPQSFVREMVENSHKADELPMKCTEESSKEGQFGIFNTVSEAENTFWCSEGANNKENDEFLRYSLVNVSFVFCLGVKLHGEKELNGDLTDFYPPEWFRVKIGVKNDVWDYVSDPISAKKTGNMQFLVIFPQIVAGKYIQIDLIGKTTLHKRSQLYFTQIQRSILAHFPLKFPVKTANSTW